MGDRIEQVDTFVVDSGGPKAWLFVKLVSRDGVTGWGECYTAPGRELAIEHLARELGRYLVGRDPFTIKHFTTVAYLDIATKRGSMDFFCALSGVEAAMWDLVGKTLEQPVHRLLGGPFRERVRVYANGWSYDERGSGTSDPDVAAARAIELVRRGFDALKFDPFAGVWRPFLSRQEIDAAVRCVAAVREAVGPEVDLLIEVHRRLAPAPAVRFARAIEELDPFWLEEPVPSTNLAALSEVRRDCSMPVVTGEALYLKSAFLPVFAGNAADIINPDVAACGGILELVEIAALADAHLVAVAPHNYNSTALALAATLQASAVMPNLVITEYFVNFETRSAELLAKPLSVDHGYVDVPSGPGLGVEVVETQLRRMLCDGRRPLRSVPLPAQEH